MIKRCQNPNEKAFKNYGARGITVCPEWRDDFAVFREWALARGYALGLTIDRENVNGNYEPDNCRWIPKGQQAQENNRHLTPVIQDERVFFPRAALAVAATGVDPSSITKVARGKARIAGGSHWRYADEDDVALEEEFKRERGD